MQPCFLFFNEILKHFSCHITPKYLLNLYSGLISSILTMMHKTISHILTQNIIIRALNPQIFPIPIIQVKSTRTIWWKIDLTVRFAVIFPQRNPLIDLIFIVILCIIFLLLVFRGYSCNNAFLCFFLEFAIAFAHKIYRWGFMLRFNVFFR